MSILKYGLSSKEICNYLKYENMFLGCFSSNQLPDITSYPCSIIVNTEKSNHPGGHWVALLLQKDCSFYFDSFGLPVLEEDIFNYLERCYKKITYNLQCIQDIESVSCGLYCISFVKHVHSIKTFTSFIKNFSLDHLKSNDLKVLHLL